MIVDPSIARVAADMKQGDFLIGCDAGCWRIVSFQFPTLDFAISATEPNGAEGEYGFRAELSNYAAQAPMVRIWDHDRNVPLPSDRRPKGGQRVEQAFKSWGEDTVYRPWDRKTGAHNNNANAFPHLAWNPERRLVFIFEDLHAILNCNARARNSRAPA